MTRKASTIRLPEELAESAEAVARVRGVSMNTLIVDALSAEVEAARSDSEFMDQLRALVDRDRQILDRLAE